MIHQVNLRISEQISSRDNFFFFNICYVKFLSFFAFFLYNLDIRCTLNCKNHATGVNFINTQLLRKQISKAQKD